MPQLLGVQGGRAVLHQGGSGGGGGGGGTVPRDTQPMLLFEG